MAEVGKRVLGVKQDNKLITEPRPTHSLLLAAAGGWKTTAGATVWLMSILADQSRAIIVNDCKDGEIAAQCADMCAKYGRRVAIIDDFNILGHDNPYSVSINPFGGVIDSHECDKGELLFSSENANHALIEEPNDDAKNQYWRDEPRTKIEFATNTLLNRNPDLATPGGVWSLISNPQLLYEAARIEAEEGDEASAALGRHIIDMRDNNPEHFAQHRGAAIKALRIFSAGSALHHAGVSADVTHLELLQQKYVVFIVGPQRHMERLGAYYALHLQSFSDALLSRNGLSADFILDEFTNAPLKALVSRLTTMRGYGGRCHMIAQSRSEVQRKYGEKETATIEENAVVKQWFGFSSFEEAERISKAMGEIQNVSHGMGVNSDKMEFSGNLSTGRERLFTADELMRLPPDEQIIHVKDVGFIHAKKLRQNEIAPYCFDLADNPIEGGRLEPQPKVELPIGDGRVRR